MTEQLDHIIVGQGIAGTVLAMTCLENQKKILIVDDAALSASSKVAAGNFNPIVFKRLVKSWKADTLIPFADQFYRKAEQLLGSSFYWEKEIVKLFVDEKERDFWLSKAILPENSPYLSSQVDFNFCRDFIQNNEGAAFVRGAANLYAAKFLADFRAYAVAKGLLLEKRFVYDDLREEQGGICYQTYNAKSIIFCEGHLATQNPYFSELPFKPAKGEILLVKIPGLKTDKIINKTVYMLPVGDELFLVGATYDWQDRTDQITVKAKEELIGKLKKLLKVPFEVVDQQAGVRPSISDRRPVIGMHPEHKRIGIFNGMGTKAVMLAPYFARQFLLSLDGNSTLDPEVELTRFYH